MITSVEQEYCKVLISYQPETSQVEQTRQQATLDVFKDSKKQQVKGYRKGKAPLDVIRYVCSDQINRLVKERLCQTAVDEYLFENQAKSIFGPNVQSVSLNKNDFECSLVLHLQPKITLTEYKGFEIPKPVTEPTHNRVERVLQDLRVQHGNSVPYQENDFVQTSDTVTLDIVAKKQNSEESSDLSEEGVLYKVGENTRPYLDQNILGMTAGETRTFAEKVGEDTFDFTVTVFMGIKNVPCALDDSLAQKLGLDTFDKLRDQVTGMVTTQLENETNSAIQQQILQRIVNAHPIQVPEFLIRMESENIARQFQTDYDKLDLEIQNKVREKALEMVKVSLLMEAVRDQEPDSRFSEQEILNYLRRQFTAEGKDADQMLKQAHQNGKLTGMVAALQHQITLEWLTKQSLIIE